MEPLDQNFYTEVFPFWKGLTLVEQQKIISHTKRYVYEKGTASTVD